MTIEEIIRRIVREEIRAALAGQTPTPSPSRVPPRDDEKERAERAEIIRNLLPRRPLNPDGSPPQIAFNAKQVAEKLGMPHPEVLRMFRGGEIRTHTRRRMRPRLHQLHLQPVAAAARELVEQRERVEGHRRQVAFPAHLALVERAPRRVLDRRQRGRPVRTRRRAVRAGSATVAPPRRSRLRLRSPNRTGRQGSGDRSDGSGGVGAVPFR